MKRKIPLPGEPIPRGSLFHERRYRVAKSMLPDIGKGGKMLDIGCGNGGQTELFARHFRQAFGIDLQVSRLPGFRREILNSGIDNLTILGGTAEALPFLDESFDMVTCFEVLEHVRNENQALAEILRILKSDGLLIMSVPHKWWIFETHGADLPLLPWNRVPFFSWLPKMLHDTWARARIYTQRDIQKIVTDAGFRKVKTSLLTAPMDVVNNKRIQRFLRSAIFTGDSTEIPILASTIFVSAKKCT
jgi:ubiquinone/menaquinone biosynthesis C-methylase UbiE